jgi:hypothetical protein
MRSPGRGAKPWSDGSISCPSTRCESSVRKVRLIDPRTRSHICCKCEMPSTSILTLRAVDFETGEESQSFVQCDSRLGPRSSPTRRSLGLSLPNPRRGGQACNRTRHDDAFTGGAKRTSCLATLKRLRRSPGEGQGHDKGHIDLGFCLGTRPGGGKVSGRTRAKNKMRWANFLEVSSLQ